MDKIEHTIVCFSGGHSSALAAIETVRKYGKENVVLLNHDISSHVEHQDVKRFKEDIANYCGVPITYANAPNFEALTPLEVCRRRKGFSAGTGRAFCTYELKTKPFYKYLESIKKSTSIGIVYGFDAAETDRIDRRSDIIRAMGYTPLFPIADWKRAIISTEEIGIPRPSTYRIFRHANCIGCLKAERQHWYAVYCIRPDIFEEAKQVEAEIGHSIIKGIFMAELEEKYREMRYEKNICPTEKTNPGTFWAEVNSVLPGQESLLPCDCSF